MKKHARKLSVIFLMLLSAQILTSCFGKFALIRKVYTWHNGIGGDDLTGRFIRTVLWYIPMGIVYGVVGFIDVVILNLVEFWSGTNPMAMLPGQVEQQYVMHKGKNYLMTAEYNKMTISELDVNGTAVKTHTMHFDTDNQVVMLDTPQGQIKIADFELNTVASDNTMKFDVQGM